MTQVIGCMQCKLSFVDELLENSRKCHKISECVETGRPVCCSSEHRIL